MLARNLRSSVRIAKNSGGWKTTRACTETDFSIKAQTTMITTKESKCSSQKKRKYKKLTKVAKDLKRSKMKLFGP